MSDTDLYISVVDFPPGSARNISESLESEELGELARTVNGGLIDLSTGIKKYRLSLSCSDQEAPTFGKIRRGTQAIVHPITRIEQRETDTVFALERQPASGSLIVRRTDTWASVSASVAVVGSSHVCTVAAPAGYSGSYSVSYRPILTMLFEAPPSVSQAEWDATCSWSMVLREV